MTVDTAMMEDKKDITAPKTPATVTLAFSHVDLVAVSSLVEKSVSAKETRLMGRAIRNLMSYRRQLKTTIVAEFLKQVLPSDSAIQHRLLAALETAPKDMDTDSVAEPAKDSKTAAKSASRRPSGVLPEVEVLAQLVVVIFLIDQKLLEEAKECSGAAVQYLEKLNRRSLDLLASRVYFFFSLAHERTSSLDQIRSTLLALNRTAALRHDEIGQETLLNLLLRNYLCYNLYDQAEKLRSKTQQPEAHSNNQHCRYLYYLGRIRTIQLEYTDAKECLLQALRKAPAKAQGFRIACNKWVALVGLLLGEIPQRTLFMLPGMRKALRPYFDLTNAVRIGDLELFHSVADKSASVFVADKTHNLIVRLRHNVIRTGLRRINVSYSKIALGDVAKKLRLDTPTPAEDAECIVAKAIRDGGVDAALNHREQWMQSKDAGDIYSTVEPQAAFHSRIAFCLNTHNEAIKAMRFPQDPQPLELESGEKRRERQQQEQELANTIAEEEGDDF